MTLGNQIKVYLVYGQPDFEPYGECVPNELVLSIFSDEVEALQETEDLAWFRDYYRAVRDHIVFTEKQYLKSKKCNSIRELLDRFGIESYNELKEIRESIKSIYGMIDDICECETFWYEEFLLDTPYTHTKDGFDGSI